MKAGDPESPLATSHNKIVAAMKGTTSVILINKHTAN